MHELCDHWHGMLSCFWVEVSVKPCFVGVQMVHKVVYHYGVLSRMQLVLLQFSTEVTLPSCSFNIVYCFRCMLLLQILCAVYKSVCYSCVLCESGWKTLSILSLISDIQWNVVIDMLDSFFIFYIFNPSCNFQCVFEQLNVNGSTYQTTTVVHSCVLNYMLFQTVTKKIGSCFCS